MTIEQPSEFNRLICPPTVWGWHHFWKMVFVLSPMLFLSFVIFAETVFLNGESFADWLGGMIGLGLLSILLGTVSLVSQRRGKRTMRIEDKAIYISPNQQARISWKTLKACHFEPIEENETFRKLTLVAPSGGRLQRWSILLADADQQKSVLEELKERQRRSFGKFVIKQFSVPIRYPELKAHSFALWLYVSAFLLLLHGSPLFLWWTPPDNKGANHAHEKRVNPRVQKYLASHFFSKNLPERHRILLGYCGPLVFSGGLCLLLSGFLQAKHTRTKRDAMEAAEAKVRSSII